MTGADAVEWARFNYKRSSICSTGPIRYGVAVGLGSGFNLECHEPPPPKLGTTSLGTSIVRPLTSRGLGAMYLLP